MELTKDGAKERRKEEKKQTRKEGTQGGDENKTGTRVRMEENGTRENVREKKKRK